MITAWFSKLFRRRGADEMTCHEVGELLQRYLDGHVDGDRSRRIEEHLEHCRRCGLEAAPYERIKATLAEQRPDVPAESVERLREFGERLLRGEIPPDP